MTRIAELGFGEAQGTLTLAIMEKGVALAYATTKDGLTIIFSVAPRVFRL